MKMIINPEELNYDTQCTSLCYYAIPYVTEIDLFMHHALREIMVLLGIISV